LTGVVDFASLSLIMETFGSDLTQFDSLFLFVSFGLILTAIMVKLGVVPFHWWIADVYGGAQLFAVGFLLTVGKLGLFGVLVRLVWDIFFSLHALLDWFHWLGLFSVLVGGLGAFQQVELRRLFAFSGVVNVGFLLLGLAGGFHWLSVAAFLFYLVNYILLSLIFFLIVLCLETFKSTRTLVDFRVFANSARFHLVAVTVSVFALAGLPPLAGFFMKVLVYLSLVDGGWWWLVFILLFSAVLAVIYYFRFFRFLFFETHRAQLLVVGGSGWLGYFLIYQFMTLVFIFGCFPLLPIYLWL
jgi:NADH-quinone oxidoreductase subunit N